MNRFNSGSGRSGGGQSPNGPQSMRSAAPITAPYNFVPLSKLVWFPDWADQVSHDRPFSDGICGTLDFELEAHTDLLVSGEKEGEEARGFFRLPDGRAAVPGSSLRGMLRSVLEVVAFGKMQLVDDRALSVRDLNNQDMYGRHMTSSSRGDNGAVFESRSRAGWLQFKDGDWTLVPVRHWRVRYDALDAYTGLQWSKTLTQQARMSAPEKYRELLISLKEHARTRTVWLMGDREPVEHLHGEKMALRYRAVEKLSASDFAPAEKLNAHESGKFITRGEIVVTGHVGKKRSDFIFESIRKADVPIVIDDEVVRSFLQIHSAELDSDWNTHFKPKALAGNKVPVFYLTDDQERPRAMGLAQMFRLPYTFGIHDAVRHTSQAHFETRSDLPELLFGHLSSAGMKDGLRSRVSVGLAVECEAPRQLAPADVVLNSPKPSFYPNYIAQGAAAEQSGLAEYELSGRDKKAKSLYRTLMSDGVQLRGRKRYPVRSRSEIQSAPASRITSRIQPVAAGARFAGSLRVHNLRPLELGALLWVLNWGGRTNLRHGLGLGKSMGCGAVSMRITQTTLNANAGHAPDPAGLMVQFEQHMDSLCRTHLNKDWLATEPMFELLAMADPNNAQSTGNALHHMVLAPDGRKNQFKDAKGSSQQNIRGAVLRSYSAMAGLSKK